MDASLDRDVETIEGNLNLVHDGRVELTSHEGEADEDEPEDGYCWRCWLATEHRFIEAFS
jgi:hypothetical protein